MMGPKRGIEMSPPVLVELDIRIKSGGSKEDDLGLIDGELIAPFENHGNQSTIILLAIGAHST